MNLHSYRDYYGAFRSCAVTATRDNLMVLSFSDDPWETWSVLRLGNAESVILDAQQPFVLALKAFFRSDEPVSVFLHQDSWTALLGHQRTVMPMVPDRATFYLYVTPYFVENPSHVRTYMAGRMHPAYDHVYFYKNTILFLDPLDVPRPGGRYFGPADPAPLSYRISFLSREPFEVVSQLAHEWRSRDNVVTQMEYLTQETLARPRFLDVRAVPEPHWASHDPHTSGTGYITLKWSLQHPDFLLQEILNGYFAHLEHRGVAVPERNIGLLVEWPLHLGYDGVRRRPPNTGQEGRQFVALAVNGQNPNRVVCVRCPYRRYEEYSLVPATQWTPVMFVRTTIPLPPHIRKVVVDSVVIGFECNKSFFCASCPILEGTFHPRAFLHTDCILSPARDLRNVRILDTFRYDDTYSIHRVVLASVPYDLWCVTCSDPLHPYPQNFRLPYLVREWLALLTSHGGGLEERGPFPVDLVRLALVLAKHKICFRMVAVKGKQQLEVASDEIVVFADQEVVDFMNQARLNETLSEEELKQQQKEGEGSWSCNIM